MRPAASPIDPALLPNAARSSDWRVFLRHSGMLFRVSASALVLAASLVAVAPSVAATKSKPKPKADSSSYETILKNADLLAACEKGDALEVRKLLGEGVSPNAARSSGASALTYAIAGRHTEVVRLLLEAKADPNRASLGMPPLFLASEKGDVKTVELLLKHGANVNARIDAVDEELKVRNGDTALIASAAPGISSATARLLIKSGADVNVRADNGKTAVIQAVASENLDVLKALLEAKADVRARMEPPEAIDALSLAVGKGRADMVEVLIAAGADVNVKLDDEVTLLEFAILSEAPEVASRLRKAGLKDPSRERIAALKKAAQEQ
jgi:ankyrin repeat protein